MKQIFKSLNSSTLLILLLFISLNTNAQIPNGYYDAATGKTGYELKTALHSIIKNHTDIGYDGVWNAFVTTDKKSNGKVWDMYSDNPKGTPPYEYNFINDQCGNYSGEASCYNREHSFPKSWFNDAPPMHNDLFHLYPTDGYVNGKRSNYPFGEVKSPTWTSRNGSKLGNCSFEGYSSTVFEPIDEYKGDFARTYFYMATRYEDKITGFTMPAILNGTKNQVYKEWYLKLLFKWHEQDPVSEKETNRNNAVHKIQKNRNPYIDHPEYAALIWEGYGNGTVDPNPDPEPTIITLLNEKFNSALGVFSQYNVEGDEIWNNKSYSGNTFAEMNGYVNGNTNSNEDWLISPALDIKTEYKNTVLSFKSAQKYGDGTTTKLQVLILKNYTQNSNPRSGTTETIDITSNFQYSAGNYEWKPSGEFNLEPYKGAVIHIAFVYTTTAAARLWRIDDVLVKTEKSSTAINYEQLYNIKVYPNPASDKINVQTGHRQIEKINIYNTLGSKISTLDQSGQQCSVDIQSLKKGIYLLEITLDNNIIIHKKFIKN